MSFYPPEEWEIRPDDEFMGYVAIETTRPVSAEILLQLNRAGNADANFRCTLNGTDLLKLEISAAAILPLDVANGYKLSLQRRPRDIIININSTCSNWWDLQASIADKTILVTKANGGADDHNLFLRNLHQEAARGAVGAALRWAVAVSPSNTLELQLQSLPLPEPFISTKPLLTADNVAVVVVKKWPISCPTFSGEKLWGPVPVIFSEQPEELRSVLDLDPARHIPEFNKMSAKFLSFETIR